MAFGYINSANQEFKEDCEYDEERDKILRIAEALMWIDLINQKEDFIIKLIPDLIIDNKDIELAKELLKKYYE
jgi:hypothetical protein